MTVPKTTQWNRLYYKYAHVGCPAARMEDNCAHPDRCADNGRCIDLEPVSFDPKEIGFSLNSDEETLRALEQLREEAALAALNRKKLLFR